jgi:endonuclease G
MRISKLLAVLFGLSLFFSSCRKDNMPEDGSPAYQAPPVYTTIQRSAVNFPETLENGSKGAYAAADVTLTTGSWNFTDALIGTSTSDRKNGSKSIRIQNSGTVTMNFDVVDGASSVSVFYAKYGTDANSTFEIWASTNAGAAWQQVGTTVTASSTTLTQVSFNTAFSGNVRFQLRKTSGGRLNIDDIDIQDNSSTPTLDDNMGMGNPSAAVPNAAFPNNYLMTKQQFALSYNSSKGTPNWVSWHLSPAWKGTAPRCDCFTQDNTLPTGFYKASTSNYTNTGFDRGHQCPSEDRDLNSTDNAATFLMTNIMPQAPNLNRVTWVDLEDYCRTLINSGNELYIMAGGYGSGGTGSNGGITYSFANGKVNVPARYWKVIVVLPVGTNDAGRVSAGTRVIAVDMPNVQTVNSQPWGNYRVSVDAIEAATGYDFLSNVSTTIQSSIEAAVDNGPTQ